MRPRLLLFSLGEAEDIALAQFEAGSLKLTDDRKARRVAKQLDIETQGTLGVLARVKRRGPIPAVRPFAQRLQAASSSIAGRTLEEVLYCLGE